MIDMYFKVRLFKTIDRALDYMPVPSTCNSTGAVLNIVTVVFSKAAHLGRVIGSMLPHYEASLIRGIVGSAGPGQAGCMTSQRQPTTCYRKTKFSSNRHRKLQPFRET